MPSSNTFTRPSLRIRAAAAAAAVGVSAMSGTAVSGTEIATHQGRQPAQPIPGLVLQVRPAAVSGPLSLAGSTVPTPTALDEAMSGALGHSTSMQTSPAGNNAVVADAQSDTESVDKQSISVTDSETLFGT